MNRHSTLPLAIAAALFGATNTHAQPAPIEEIVVNADFRQAAIDELSASISVVDRDLMRRRNALHLEDVLLNAPNVNFASGASRARFIQIRGIGERGQFTEPLNPSVGLLIDGVDFSGIGGAALLYDLEQVEILMGPQGTRYGSNALAGLINLQSRAPTTNPSYGLQLQGENFGGYGLAGYLSGPLGPTLGYRLSAQSLESDGFSTNTFLGRDTNYRDELSLRGKLRWQPADDVTLDLTAARIDIDNGYDAFSLDNTRDTLSDEPGFDTQEATLASLRLRADSFAAFSVEALAGFARSENGYGYDEDWVHTGFHPFEYSSTDHYFRDRDTFTGELRLLSSENGLLFGGRSAWVAGLYVLEQKVDLRRNYTFLPAPFTSGYDTSRLALYAETNTELGPRWSLDLGLRGERFEASYRDSDALRFDPDDSLAGGKLALNYHTAAGNLLYASVSRGYKSGGFNTDGSLDPDLREFGKELLWNHELGFKGQLLDGRLQTRAALFFMEREDVQISSSLSRLRPDGSSEFLIYTGNAAAGSNRGLELSLQWTAPGAFSPYATLGLLDTEYEDFTNSAGANLDGREQAHAPSYQYTVGVTWTLAPALEFDLNAQGRDGFYFSDSHATRSPSSTVVNDNLTWRGNNCRATLWGRNLGDEDYYVRGYYFGNDPRKDYVDEAYTQLGEPRRFGLSLNLEF